MQEEAKKEEVAFLKAAKVTQWEGWIYCEGMDHNDGFFDSVSDLLEFCEDEGISPPKYAWTCSSRSFVTIDLDDILQRIEEDGFEDYEASDAKGLAELKLAIEAFNLANESTVIYEPNYSTAVIISL